MTDTPQGNRQHNAAKQINLGKILRQGFRIPQRQHYKAQSGRADECHNRRTQTVQNTANRTDITIFEE